MEDLEKKTRRITQKAKEVAEGLSRPQPLLSELFGDVGRVEMYGRAKDGERFIAELGPSTRITAQMLPREPNPNREVLWETRTWDNWAVQLVHYSDTHKVYLFLNHGPHYTAKLIGPSDANNLKNSLRKAIRRLENAEKRDGPSKTERKSLQPSKEAKKVQISR